MYFVLEDHFRGLKVNFNFEANAEDAVYFKPQKFDFYTFLNRDPGFIILQQKKEMPNRENKEELLNFLNINLSEELFSLNIRNTNGEEKFSIRLGDFFGSININHDVKEYAPTDDIIFRRYNRFNLERPVRRGEVEITITPNAGFLLKELKNLGYSYEVTVVGGFLENKIIFSIYRTIRPLNFLLIIISLWSVWRIVHLFETRRLKRKMNNVGLHG